jgi:hypothetical protein
MAQSAAGREGGKADRTDEVFERGDTGEAFLIHEDRRRGRHALRTPHRGLGSDSSGVASGVQASVEGVTPQTKIGGKAFEGISAEGATVSPGLRLHQPIVVGPKSALFGSALRSFGRPDRFVAEEGKMAVDDPCRALRDDGLLELTPWTQGVSFAGRSLEVAPFFNENGRIGVALGLRGVEHRRRHHAWPPRSRGGR